MYDIVNSYIFEYLFNSRIDFQQHVSEDRFDIYTHGAIPTWGLPVKGKNAPVFKRLVNVEKCGGCRVTSQSGATQ